MSELGWNFNVLFPKYRTGSSGLSCAPDGETYAVAELADISVSIQVVPIGSVLGPSYPAVETTASFLSVAVFSSFFVDSSFALTSSFTLVVPSSFITGTSLSSVATVSLSVTSEASSFAF